MYRICKRFSFEASHKLKRAYSQVCSDNIHGHSYVVEVVIAARCLNADGMVVDFGRLKQYIHMIKGEWDHSLILHREDAEVLGINQPRMVVVNYNPTAESMAMVFFGMFSQWISGLVTSKGQKLRVERVRVHETATGWAEYTEVIESCP